MHGLLYSDVKQKVQESSFLRLKPVRMEKDFDFDCFNVELSMICHSDV